MEQLVKKLSEKERLDVCDASELLQFLQIQSESFLSQQRSSQASSRLAHCHESLLESATSSAGLASRVTQNGPILQSPFDIGAGGGINARKNADSASRDQRRDGGALDLSSMSEFPPMKEGGGGKKMSSGERKKDKSSSAKPGRRITLTPLTSTPQPATHQFSSPHSSDNCWKSNPAFTNHFTSSERPVSLAEERKLLQQERSRMRQRQGNRTAPVYKEGGRKGATNSRDQSVTYSSGGERDRGETRSGGGGRRGASSAGHRGQSSGQSSLGHHGRSLEEESKLDSKLSSHSIFELNSSARGKHCSRASSSSPHMQHSVQSYQSSNHTHHSVNSTHHSTGSTHYDINSAHHSADSSHHSAMFSQASPYLNTSHNAPPLTSTPLLCRGPSEAAPTNVTNQNALDVLSHHYAALIKGHMLPSFTSEIHFVFQLLTVTTAHTPPINSSIRASSKLFESVDNCVYFAVTVLDKIKDLLASLDRSTLQLLADNTRIADFNSDLSAYFVSLSDNSVSLSSSHSNLSHNSSYSGGGGVGGGAGRRSFGVPFQEETDNSRNFTHMKAFHAFKKQRDLFYLVMREWEENHTSSNWNMADSLRDKIRVLIQQHGEVCSLAHFARLFQRQLVESCRRPLLCQLSPSPGGRSHSLMVQLGKTDPERLMKLTERFFLPSSGGGPHPPPSFSPMEEFFTNFILTADSYTFNHHLKATLCSELLKLHRGCGLLHPKDVEDTVYTMRALAKFLGFLDFLPYRKSAPDSMLHAREMMTGPLDLHQCVGEACGRGHLCVTVPWCVSYLSLMDQQAVKLIQLCSLFTKLIDVYRCLSLTGGVCGRTSLLIAASLGWLFETPNFPSSLFFEHIKAHPSPSLTLSLSPEHLDSKDVVSVDLLYTCCGYLGEFRSILAGFAAGLQPKPSPMRKIKPISADIEPEQSSPVKQLQIQLEENFFRCHPTYLKQLCDVAAERVSLSAIASCESTLLPDAIAHGVRQLTAWLKERHSLVGVANSDVTMATDHLTVDEPFTQIESEGKLLQVVFETSHCLMERVDNYVDSFCKGHCLKALEGLLSGSLSNEVIKTSSDITSVRAKEKCLKWAAEKIRGLVHEELTKVFEKSKRLLKSAMKSKETADDWSRLRGKSLLISGVDASVASRKAGPLGNDLDTSMNKFREVAEAMLTKEGLTSPQAHPLFARLSQSLSYLSQHIYHCSFITTALPTPQALPPDASDKTLSLSADVAVLLVSQGLLTRQKFNKDGEDSLINKLLLYWKLMKSLKVDVPVHKLLNATAFEKYFNSGNPLVWVCLSDVIVGLLLEKVASSSLVEGLWLSRRHQLSREQFAWFLKGASVFLERWFTMDESTATPPPPPPSPPSSLPTPSPSAITLPEFPLKQVHFVRLLSLVLNELDRDDVPPSLLSTELIHLQHLVLC